MEPMPEWASAIFAKRNGDSKSPGLRKNWCPIDGMYRARPRRLVCTGKVCRKSYASLAFEDLAGSWKMGRRSSEGLQTSGWKKTLNTRTLWQATGRKTGGRKRFGGAQ